MARELPVIELKGEQYFVDERLHELRNTCDPFDRLPLPLAMECALLASRREYKKLLKRLRPKDNVRGG